MKLHNPSTEQLAIINNLKNGNVLVQAVAGSGKTTVSLHIAKSFSDLKILLLTYNARLKTETRQKAKSLQLKNLEVHSFHAFGLKYYQEKRCITDKGLNKIIDEEIITALEMNFDIIIIDEAQDITPLYYEFICKLVTDNLKVAKICLLGDKNQSIYGFNNADSRYISFANKLLNFNSFNWINCALSESFRVNDKTVDFINEVFYEKPLMKSTKLSPYQPEYIITNVYDSKEFYQKIKQEIMYWGYENIFILAPSLRSDKSPIKKFSNKLSDEGIPIFVPSDDDEKLEAKFLDGKLVFSTYHQAKGLERKLVIIFNFDNSYFKYYDRNANPVIPPNPLYVAITRSLEKLILVHHYDNPYLKFLNRNKLFSYCQRLTYLTDYEYRIFQNKLHQVEGETTEQTDINVSQLVRHVPQNIIKLCMDKLKISRYQNKWDKFSSISLNNYVTEKGFIEQVANITGTAIPLYYEWACKKAIKEINVVKTLLNFFENLRDYALKEYATLFKYEMWIKNLALSQNFTSSDLLKLANIWVYIVDKFNFKLNQISADNYNWITEEDLTKVVAIMTKHISEDSVYEQHFNHSNDAELYNKSLSGYIDCIDYKNQNIWEFKCVSRVNDVHFLQLAVYAYLFEVKSKYEISKLKIAKPKIINYDLIAIGDVIECYKWRNLMQAKVVGFNATKSKVIVIQNETIKKVKPKHFLRNITLQNSLKDEETRLTNNYHFRIFNILKDEIYEISYDPDDLKQIVDLLVWNKYFEYGKITDLEFMTNNQKIKDKYFLKILSHDGDEIHQAVEKI